MLRGILLGLAFMAMAPQAQAVVVKFDVQLNGAGGASSLSGSFRLDGPYRDGIDAGEPFPLGSGPWSQVAFNHNLFGYFADAISAFAPIRVGGATFGAGDLHHPLEVEYSPAAVWFDREPIAGSSPLMWMGLWKTVGGITQYLQLGGTRACSSTPDTICLTTEASASDGLQGHFGSIRASVVPVPASLALIGSALAGLGFVGRRRSDAG
jgi:hypothetical protein